MLKKQLYYFLFLSILFSLSCNGPEPNNHINEQDPMNNYQLLKNWPDFPPGFKLGNPTGIGIDTSQNIFIFNRADRKWPLVGPMPGNLISSKTILMVDRNSGKMLKSWGGNLFIMPHGLTVDGKNNVWVTDVGLHQVFKFSHDGELLMKLGEAGIPGNDSTHFNLPADVVIAKDGSFYVSDGYGNSRVVKFSPDSQFLFEWGKKGNREAEFNIPHAVDLDDAGNVYIADRENCRVQVFSPSGKFIKQWTNKSFGNISSIAYDKEKKGFIVVDYFTSWVKSKVTRSSINIVDSSGNLTGNFGKKEGNKSWYHNVVVDNQGSIYITDILGNRIQKFIKTPAEKP